MNTTVKQFKDTIEEMRTIYPFDDDKSYISTFDILRQTENIFRIRTVDEKTGITVILEKNLKGNEKNPCSDTL